MRTFLATFTSLFVALLPIAQAQTPFDCDLFLKYADEGGSPSDQPIEETIAHFDGKEVTFEEALGWVANFLEPADKANFIAEVKSQLTGVEVFRTRPRLIERFFPQEDGVRYWTFKFTPAALTKLGFYFGAIRIAFSKDFRGSKQWLNADAEDRLDLEMTFKSRAARVLFYQYKVYCLLRDVAVDANTIHLASDMELRVPIQQPRRFFNSRHETGLFEKIRLTSELVRRIESEPNLTDNNIMNIVEDYVNVNYTNRIDALYSYRQAVFRAERLSAIAVVALGVGSAYLFTPKNPPKVPTTPGTISNAPTTQSLDLNLPPNEIRKQLEEIRKTRTLNDQEQTILDALTKAK